MRILLALIAGAALALGPATLASAKEIASVKACGADGCRDVTALATDASLEGGPATSAPERAAAFFRIEVAVRAGGETDGWSSVYVPSAQKVRGDDGTWMNPATTTLRELDRLVRGRTPLPAEGLGLPMPDTAPPSPPPAGGGLPEPVWILIAAGALGLLGAALTVRRRGAAPAG